MKPFLVYGIQLYYIFTLYGTVHNAGANEYIYIYFKTKYRSGGNF